MSVSLSAANSAALAVLRTNDSDVMRVQNRISTGKEVNSAADDPVRYFRSLDLTRRASRLTDISKNIDLAATGIKLADTAMTSMRSSLDSTLKTIQEARGTGGGSGNASAVPLTMTGRTFSATSATATKVGAALATAAEVAATGKSLQNIVRSKQLFDKDTNTGNNAASATSDGNLGLAIPAGANPKLVVRISTGGANLDVTVNTTTSGRDTTVGDLVDAINTAAKGSGPTALQGITANITADGKLRVSSGSTAPYTISFAAASDTVAATYGGAANGTFGFVTNDSNLNPIAAGNAAAFSAYDASMIGTGLNQFQEGDTFTFSVADKTGNTRSVTFQAVTAANRTPYDASQGSVSNPIKFTTVGDLADALNAKFGSVEKEGRVLVDLVNAGGNNTAGTSALRLTLADPTASVTITQIKNVDSTNFTTATNSGAPVRTLLANDFAAIFGGTGVQTTSLDSALTDVSQDGEVIYRERQQFATLSYSAPAATNTGSDAKRVAAAEAYKSMLNMFNRTFNDAKLTTAGMPNLLNQETLKVNLGTTTTYDITLGGKLDALSLGLTSNNGNLPSFSTDADIDASVLTMTTAISTITTQQGLLAQHSVALNGYQGFVNAISTINQNYADDITRADVNAESNNLKALQTMQQMVQAMMSINNSMEGGASRLLY